jgi:hypothetical protein
MRVTALKEVIRSTKTTIKAEHVLATARELSFGICRCRKFGRKPATKFIQPNGKKQRSTTIARFISRPSRECVLRCTAVNDVAEISHIDFECASPGAGKTDACAWPFAEEVLFHSQIAVFF